MTSTVQVFPLRTSAIRHYRLDVKNEDDADDAVVDTLIRFLNRRDRDI